MSAAASFFMSHIPRQHRKTSMFWVVFFVIFAVAMAVSAMYKSDIASQSITLRPSYALTTILLQIAFMTYASLLWARLLNQTTQHKISLKESFIQINAVTIGKYIPGKIWGLVARGSRLKSAGLTTKDYVKASFMEQYLLILGCLILTSISAPLLIIHPLSSLAPATTPCGILLAHKLQKFFFKRYNTITKNAEDEIPITISLYDFTKLSIMYTLLWVSSGLVFYGVALSTTNINPTTQNFTSAINANAIGVTAGFLALFSPGGIGIREGSIAAIISPSMGLKIAIYIAIVYRAFTIASELICGAIALSISNRNVK